jgi:hypothetical protein
MPGVGQRPANNPRHFVGMKFQFSEIIERQTDRKKRTREAQTL